MVQTNISQPAIQGSSPANGARTIEAWVYRTNESGEQHLFSYGSLATDALWKLSILPSLDANVMHLDIDSTGCNSTTGVAAGAWHYVAATYDGSTVRFYIDGDPAGSCTLAHTSNAVLNGTAYVGAFEALADFFDGSIDQVKFSIGAKSATVIYNYYHGL